MGIAPLILTTASSLGLEASTTFVNAFSVILNTAIVR
jgi:hypothetical protein